MQSTCTIIQITKLVIYLYNVNKSSRMNVKMRRDVARFMVLSSIYIMNCVGICIYIFVSHCIFRVVSQTKDNMLYFRDLQCVSIKQEEQKNCCQEMTTKNLSNKKKKKHLLTEECDSLCDECETLSVTKNYKIHVFECRDCQI